MTILTVCQSVASDIGLTVPTAVMSSTTREHVELAALANRSAKALAKGHDWSRLKTLETLTGDGTTTQFTQPSDYARMLKKAQIWSTSLEGPLRHIADTDEWLGLDVKSYDFVVNAWTIIGSNVELKPALGSTVTAYYYYITNLVVQPVSGSNKTDFTSDDDTFLLDEEMLTLEMIWRWKAKKGFAYAEDMVNAESHKAREITNDAGSRMLRIGRPRIPRDVKIAYPTAISG